MADCYSIWRNVGLIVISMAYLITEVQFTSLGQSLTVSCYLNEYQTNCSSIEACHEDKLTIMLTYMDNDFNSFVVWIFPNGTCSRHEPQDMIHMDPTPNNCRNKVDSCGPFKSISIDPGIGKQCTKNNLTAVMKSNLGQVVVGYGILLYDGSKNVTGMIRIQAKALVDCTNRPASGTKTALFRSSSSDAVESSTTTKTTLNNYFNSKTGLPSSSFVTETSLHNSTGSPVLGSWQTICIVFIIVLSIVCIVLICLCYHYRKQIIAKCCKKDEEKVPEPVRIANPQSIPKSGSLAKENSNQSSLAKKITMKQLNAIKINQKETLMNVINKHWKKLAADLNIPINEPAKSMRGSSLVSEWLKKKPTWNDLIEVLENNGLTEIAQRVKNEVTKKDK